MCIANFQYMCVTVQLCCYQYFEPGEKLPFLHNANNKKLLSYIYQKICSLCINDTDTTLNRLSEGLWVQASPQALQCVLENDMLSSAWYWFNPGKPVPT